MIKKIIAHPTIYASLVKNYQPAQKPSTGSDNYLGTPIVEGESVVINGEVRYLQPNEVFIVRQKSEPLKLTETLPPNQFADIEAHTSNPSKVVFQSVYYNGFSYPEECARWTM